MTARETLKIRAVRAEQGEGVSIFAFFLYGADIHRIADITRIRREDNELKGFQRREIRDHVKQITAFLDSGPVLFPNAVILALSPEVDLPRRAAGCRAICAKSATQGRSLSRSILKGVARHDRRWAAAIAGARRSKGSFHRRAGHRFCLCRTRNAARAVHTCQQSQALPTRLINELLPEVSVLLPRDLAVRQPRERHFANC